MNDRREEYLEEKRREDWKNRWDGKRRKEGLNWKINSPPKREKVERSEENINKYM
jgi:hypothetical protein